MRSRTIPGRGSTAGPRQYVFKKIDTRRYSPYRWTFPSILTHGADSRIRVGFRLPSRLRADVYGLLSRELTTDSFRETFLLRI